VNDAGCGAGSATPQAADEEADRRLFDTVDCRESRVSGDEWLVGVQLTASESRLFTTLVRFAAVYHAHFKCNLRRIADHPALHAFTARMMDVPGVRDTVHFDHIKRHYYESHATINPTGVVPVGPEMPF